MIAKSIPGSRIAEVEEELLGESAQVRGKGSSLSKQQMTAVVWTTPLGLPIVQPYRKIKRRQISTGVQSVYISDPNAIAEGK